MSPFITTLIEWGATLLSLFGFGLCIRHRSSCFVVFMVADLGWFASAWMNGHVTLLAQQSVYILLNIVGFVMWRRDERLRQALERIESRDLPARGFDLIVEQPPHRKLDEAETQNDHDFSSPHAGRHADYPTESV